VGAGESGGYGLVGAFAGLIVVIVEGAMFITAEWLLLGVVAATVIISATVSASLSCTSTAACHVGVTKLSLTGTYLGQAVVAIVAVLGLL